MSVAEDMFPLLTKLDKREKLRLMQFLVSDLVSSETEAHPDWPPGYFRQTFGAFRDDPLERPEQGEFEIREEIA
ncbi:MAG TPA: hypothetical protein EYP41_05320 [Anaerolineae bacterium]|nr:hypothetical protein [Anaerolineae bacterium]HIP73847.1 hypothetical protein [Anaerolineae bacterium]